MDNNLKILGIIIIEKKYAQMDQYVHHQNHLGHIDLNIIKINNVHLNVMKHMLNHLIQMIKSVIIPVYIIITLIIKATIV